MTAALGSGSAPPPSLPQPQPWAPRVILVSAPSRFEATSQLTTQCRQPSGPPEAANLRPNPLLTLTLPLTLTLTLTLTRRAAALLLK